MTAGRYYITTAIPYVNSKPHLGFALEVIQADVLARYHRQLGGDTRFQTGTDDNALKNVQAAEAEGISTQLLVDRNAAAFAALRTPLDLSFDHFVRTSGNPQHAAGAAKLWAACAAAGDIYKKSYAGLYCIGCEQFYNESELVNGLCPEHLRPPEAVSEENHFFRLSRYGEQLRELITSGTLRIEPAGRRNEVLRFIEGGLQDFSISRSQTRARGWGISVPDDPQQVMYVWWDALINYITALDYATDGPLFTRYWQDNPARVHVIGKGIVRFHAIYWPAMLLSAGLPLPTTIYVHEYVTVEGQKISKSLGNAIDPVALVERFGTDPLRYWLLRDVPRTEDGDFTVERLIARTNGDLANDLGNLLNRTVSMIGRWRGGVVPTLGLSEPPEQRLRQLAASLPERIAIALDCFDFRTALAALWELVGAGNRYVDETAPWTLARHPDDQAATARLDTVLATLAETLRLIAVHLTPFLPAIGAQILAQLGVTQPGTVALPENQSWGSTLAGTSVATAKPIIPRIEVTSPPAPPRRGEG
jgi:methionyl-tRNA synthetase